MIRIGKQEKITSILVLTISLVIPIFSFAQTQGTGLVPCTNTCGYYDLLKLVNNIIDWVITISVPIAAGVIAYAGFILMTTGIADKKSEAKSMIKKVLVGLVFILAAWILVSTLLNALLKNPQSVPVDITK